MLTLDLACPIAWRTTTTATTTPGRLEQQALSSAAVFSPTTPTLTTRGKADVQKDYFGDVVEIKKGDIVGSSELLSKLDAGVEIAGDQGGERGGEGEEEEGEEEGVRWLARRYHETLWLGEEHSPLTGFLHHLSRFEREERRRRIGVAARKGNRSINGKDKAESHVESFVSLQARSLLRNRRQIRKRYASAATAAEGERGTEEGTVVSLSSSSSSSQNTKRDTFVQELARDHTHGRVNPCAEEMIKMAIESGPGRLVGDELSRLPTDKSDDPKKGGMGRMTKAWLQAIECRELQIQTLLVLYLLQLSTRLPSSSSGASTTTTTPPKGMTSEPLADRQDEVRSPLQSIVEPNAPIDATPPSISTSTTKRKRKADHAQRWTGVGGSKGMMAAFPWTLQRQTGGREGQSPQQSSRFGGGGGGEEDDDDCVSAESLSKRFESLLDSLSLQMLTCSIGLDANSIFSSPSSSKIIRVRERLQPWQLFGSEGRRRQRSSKDDKKDVLQWLCCSVIEPYFSKTLPRQCGIVRGKCFIPGSGTTPAKPARKEHHHIKARSERDKEKDREKRKRDRDRDRQEEDKDRTRRSVSRGKSPSPAPTPWSLLRNQAADESKQPVSRSSAFLEKLDARTVNVRKKWVRSQSIGPLPSSSSSTATSTTTGGQGDSQSQRSQQPPSRSSTSIAGRGNSVQPDPRTATQRQNQSRPVLDPKINRRESQTLVMATPSKASAYGSLPRSSSFSTANAVPFHPSSSSSITSMNNNSWRRTESQPVLMRKGVGGKGGSQIHDDDDDAWMMGDDDGDDDIAADEQIVDSLYFDESDEEGEEERDEAGDLPLVVSPIQSKRAILDAVYHDNEKDDEDDDYGGEIVVAKKRRLLPSSFSFALLGGGGGGDSAASTQVSTTASSAPQQASSGRNPFAVSQSVDVL